MQTSHGESQKGMAYSYARLTRADVPRLRQLLAVFAAAFAEAETYLGRPPADAYLAALLGKEDFIALVAQDDGRVVGGLTAYVLAKPEQERREIYLYDLAVREGYRRRHIATNLILTLKQMAKEVGAYVIFVQADKGDTPAIRLYASLGTREDVYNFDIAAD